MIVLGKGYFMVRSLCRGDIPARLMKHILSDKALKSWTRAIYYCNEI